MNKIKGVLLGALMTLVFGSTAFLVACSGNSTNLSQNPGGSSDGTDTGGGGDGTPSGGPGDGTPTGGPGDASSTSSRVAKSQSSGLQGTWRTGCIQDADDLSSFEFTQVVFSGNDFQMSRIGFDDDASCSSGADSVEYQQGEFSLGRDVLTADGVNARTITFTGDDDSVSRDIVSRSGNSLFFGVDDGSAGTPDALDFNRPLNRQ